MATKKLPLAIMLMGPTASGKTRAAVELVRQVPVDIISVDSAMVYRGMDIGTAKPDHETLREAPHRLIDIRDPAEPYSAAEFEADALREMADIQRAGRIPLLTGGTMLYFRALEQGLSELPSADPEVRLQLETEAKRVGWPAMHARLKLFDPDSAVRIHPNDPQRIQRALEVYELTGSTMSELCAYKSRRQPCYRFLKIILAPDDRAVLHERIEKRFESMLEQGFLDEVKQLHQRHDLHSDLPAIRAVGYRQAWAFLDGRLAGDEWVERARIATRQYAKRQLTWLRTEADAQWLDPEQAGVSNHLIKLVKEACAAID